MVTVGNTVRAGEWRRSESEEKPRKGADDARSAAEHSYETEDLPKRVRGEHRIPVDLVRSVNVGPRPRKPHRGSVTRTHDDPHRPSTRHFQHSALERVMPPGHGYSLRNTTVVRSVSL